MTDKRAPHLNTLRNEVTDLLEKIESPFKDEIRMAVMPEQLKLPDAKC